MVFYLNQPTHDQLIIFSMDKEHQEVASKLKKITVMSLIFMCVELLGGYLANSIAIFADAFHLLSDVLAYLISLGAVWLSTTPNPPRYLTFGWQKAQPLGALINVVIIYIVTGQLFIQATKRMIDHEVVEEPKFMLITSIFGLICNLIIMQILHNDPHGGHHGCSHSHQHNHNHHDHVHQSDHTHTNGHCHSHSHEYHHDHAEPCQQSKVQSFQISQQTNTSIPTKEGKNTQRNDLLGTECTSDRNSGDQLKEKGQCECKHQKNDTERYSIQDNLLKNKNADQGLKMKEKKKNINIQAAYIHVLTDIILSIGVIISAAVIYFLAPHHHEWTPWQLADPLCTYLFSFLAIYSTWPILKESVFLLLDAAQQQKLVDELEKEIKDIDGVLQIAELKVWSTNRDKNYAAVRVIVSQDFQKWKIKKVMQNNRVHGFIEVEDELNRLGE